MSLLRAPLPQHESPCIVSHELLRRSSCSTKSCPPMGSREARCGRNLGAAAPASCRALHRPQNGSLQVTNLAPTVALAQLHLSFRSTLSPLASLLFFEYRLIGEVLAVTWPSERETTVHAAFGYQAESQHVAQLLAVPPTSERPVHNSTPYRCAPQSSRHRSSSVGC